jgi:hypothetical protein
VVFEKLDIALTHHSGRAEDADWKSILHGA